MRRIIPFILLSIFALTLSANPVTQRQARAKAGRFFAAHGLTFDGSSPAMMAPRRGSSPASTSPYYVFNAKDSGFVVISGDDRTPEILGYSTTGIFDMSNVPANVLGWLDEYSRQIEYIRRNNALPRAAQPSSGKVSIAPLLQTKWNQGEPYNTYCPTVNGVKAYTGCVSTAMAQVLYYNYQKYPDKMPGELKNTIPGYEYDVFWPDSIHVKVDGYNGSGGIINWSGMDSGDGRAIAELMSYCGTSITTHYASSPDGSTSGYYGFVPESFVKYFGMDPSLKYVRREAYTTVEWENLIYSELQSGRPVLYAGHPSESSGHAFVIDGYSGNDYYYVNWGWGGYCDGAFLLSVLEPSGSGIGGAGVGAGYNYDQEAVVGIKPYQGGAPQFQLFASDFSTYRYNDETYFFYYVYNGGPASDTFDVGYGLLDDDGTITPLFLPNRKTCYTVTIPPANYGYLLFNLDKSFSSSGEYKVIPIGKSHEEKEWHSLWSPGRYTSVVVSDDKPMLFYSHPLYSLTVTGLSADGPKLANIPMKLRFSATNTGEDKYSGDLYFFASKTTDRGRFVMTKGVSVDIGSSSDYEVEWSPVEAGIYNVWLCADKDGTCPLDSIKGIVIQPGHSKGTSLTLVSMNLPGEYTISTDWKLYGDRMFKTLADDEFNDCTFSLKVNESGSYVIHFDIEALDETTGERILAYNWTYPSRNYSAGNTYYFGGIGASSIGKGKYLFTLYVLNAEGTDTLWRDDTYGIIVNNVPGTYISPSDLTDASGTDGEMFLSSNLSPYGGEGIENLFDNKADTKLCARYDALPAWVIYKSERPLLLTSYALTSANDFRSRDPRAWMLEGSNDSIMWELIDSRQDQNFSYRYQTKAYTVRPTGSYKFIRFTVSSVYSSDQNDLQLAELQLFGSRSDATGISGLSAGDEPWVIVYSIHGVRLATVRTTDVGAYLKTLPRGIYIINGKKYVN